MSHNLPEARQNSNNGLDLLWLELTRTCNEKCSFCYNSSGPHVSLSKSLSKDFWINTLSDAERMGVTNLSIIGGEPLVLPWFEEFLDRAVNSSFEHIELATNATLISERIARMMGEYRVSAAISLYSSNPDKHDEVTKLQGSFLKTIYGIRMLRAHDVRIRINYIMSFDNCDETDEIKELVAKFGVTDVGTDRVRNFGRAGVTTEATGEEKTSELCGACAGRYACVSSEGDVFPCIMSRHMKSGSLKENTLEEVIEGGKMISNRGKIAEVKRTETTACNPNLCTPNYCSPRTCRPIDSCGPDKCRPQWA